MLIIVIASTGETAAAEPVRTGSRPSRKFLFKSSGGAKWNGNPAALCWHFLFSVGVESRPCGAGNWLKSSTTANAYEWRSFPTLLSYTSLTFSYGFYLNTFFVCFQHLMTSRSFGWRPSHHRTSGSIRTKRAAWRQLFLSVHNARHRTQPSPVDLELEQWSGLFKKKIATISVGKDFRLLFCIFQN